MTTVTQLKESLLSTCKNAVANRYEKVQKTIAGIVESLDGESKSSAGDKHETGRAMLQIDRENAGKQMKEIESLQTLLPRIKISQTTDIAHLGSLVFTNHGVFFLSISIGEVIIDNEQYFCVSLKAPIGQLIFGKRKGDSFSFNGKEYLVTSIK